MSEATLEKENRPALAVRLDSHWFHKRRVILKFQGIDSITSAESLVGYEVKIPRSALMPPPPGSYYQHDLLGCVLQDSRGVSYGTVAEILGNPGSYLLRVHRDTGDFLVPFAESYFLKFDVGNKVLVCDLPAGLEEL